MTDLSALIESVEGAGEGSRETCRCCGAAITSAELCPKCATGNDPFLTSKYSDGARA